MLWWQQFYSSPLAEWTNLTSRLKPPTRTALSSMHLEHACCLMFFVSGNKSRELGRLHNLYSSYVPIIARAPPCSKREGTLKLTYTLRCFSQSATSLHIFLGFIRQSQLPGASDCVLHMKPYTPKRINKKTVRNQFAPENRWLEDVYFLLGPGLFSGAKSSFQGGYHIPLLDVVTTTSSTSPCFTVVRGRHVRYCPSWGQHRWNGHRRGVFFFGKSNPVEIGIPLEGNDLAGKTWSTSILVGYVTVPRFMLVKHHF